MFSCKKFLIIFLSLIFLFGCATTKDIESLSRRLSEVEENKKPHEKMSLQELMEAMAQGEAGWEDAYAVLAAAAGGDYLIIQDVSDTTDGATGTTKYILAADLYSGIFPVLTAEPTEVVGQIYIADNDTWDPVGYTDLNDYMVLCTATDTYKLLMDMTTGERFFSDLDLSDGVLAIPSAADPTTDAAGECSVDFTDGGQIPFFLECYDEGTADASVILSSDIICESFTIIEPDTAQGVTDDVKLKHLPAEGYPFGITVTYVSVATDGTDISDAFGFEEWSDEDTFTATIETITLSTADFGDTASIDNPTLEADDYIVVDLDGTSDDYDTATLTVCYRILGGN